MTQGRKAGRRKPLRERVADRKRGIDAEEDNPRRKRWAQRLDLTGFAMSLIGIFLIALEVYQFTLKEPVEMEKVVIYSTIFVVGRIIKLTAKPVSRMLVK